MAGHGVVHFEIPADDPEKLIGFYKDLFGWEVQKMPMDGMDYYMLMTVPTDEKGMPTQPGGINGGLFKRQQPDQKPINYIAVEAVDTYVEKAQSLGAMVAMGKMPVPAMGWFAILIDPQGNPFGVWQDDPSAK
jgi:hypothetical protein